MRAQVTLTPTESKKLIGLALAHMPEIQHAAQHGTVVMHPSSSTFFAATELLGERPATDYWVCGVTVPKGTCIEIGTCVGPHSVANADPSKSATTGNPEAFRFSWVIRDGKLLTGLSLTDLLPEMGPNDVYIKGVNAIDCNRHVGILVGNLVEGGTIGKVVSRAAKNGFTLVFPVGLEKLIPIPVEEAAREALKSQYSYSTGISCGLFPCKQGIVVTETDAVRILAGCEAIPIAAGGLGGAEGAITLVLKGEDDQVKNAISYVERSKGAQLPQVRTFNCVDCHQPICGFSMAGKSWIV